MNLEELTIGQAKQLADLFSGLQKAAPCASSGSGSTGKYVVVRTYSAGVHIGVLKERSGREVVLTEARRIWSWSGANTLHEISLKGITSGRVSEPVQEITLTEAIEIIPCASEGEMNLRSQKWAK